MPRRSDEKATKPGLTVRERVTAYRRRMRAMGYRPVEIWVPDTRSSRFRASFRKECRSIAAAEQTDRGLEAWLDANTAELSARIDRTEAAAGAPPFSWGPESPV